MEEKSHIFHSNLILRLLKTVFCEKFHLNGLLELQIFLTKEK